METNSDLKFIDTHTHGAFGVNFNYASYEDVKFLLKELYKRNIKAICPTLTGDGDIYQELCILKKIKKEQSLDIKDEALILGVHLEGTFLSPEKSGIQDINTFKKPSIKNFKELVLDCEDIIKIVTIAPEENIDLIEYLKEKNIIPQAGHSAGSDLGGCLGVTHLFNAMNPIHHRTPSIALSSLLDDSVYVEIIADFIHLSHEILQLTLKTKKKNRILLISDSIPCAHYDRDIIFCKKKINPKGFDDKGKLAGSIQTIDTIIENLIRENFLNKEDISQMGFLNQIEYLKLNQREIDIVNR